MQYINTFTFFSRHYIAYHIIFIKSIEQNLQSILLNQQCYFSSDDENYLLSKRNDAPLEKERKRKKKDKKKVSSSKLNLRNDLHFKLFTFFYSVFRKAKN